jgi:hypothetical protein
MTAAYTVCSANDLGRAKTLAQSMAEQEPGIRLFIGLTDTIDNRFVVADLSPATLIEAQELHLDELQEMSEKYSITELNCAMKSFFGDHILRSFQPEKLLYFDTDIFIYRPLTEILTALDTSSLVLTPHILSPIPADNKIPRERNMLAAGLYNGGFIGMKNDETTKAFLQWWKSRMVDQAFIDPAEGMFYDQNWLNFLPLYFKNVKIITDSGHNVAYWNLHEREIRKNGDSYMVNDTPLTFFHFSGLDPFSEKISKHQDRFAKGRSAALDELFDAYIGKLKANGFAEFSRLACNYGKKPKQHSASKKILMKVFGRMGYEIKKLPG